MKSQRTHLLALRAASQVTAVSRAFRRLAVGTAASAVLLSGVAGCTSTSESSATGDAAGGAADVASRADVADLMDTILGEDSLASTDDATSRTDLGSSDGTDEADGAEGSDGLDMADSMDGSEGLDMSDGMDTTDGVDVTEDVMVADDTEDEDAGEAPDIQLVDGSSDGGELLESCLIPNGKACEETADCQDSGAWGPCVDGECHDDMLSSDEAAECCQEQMAAGNFGVEGCNPWGPPAPPVDRGYRLAKLAAMVGVA